MPERLAGAASCLTDRYAGGLPIVDQDRDELVREEATDVALEEEREPPTEKIAENPQRQPFPCGSSTEGDVRHTIALSAGAGPSNVESVLKQAAKTTTNKSKNGRSIAREYVGGF